MTPMKILVVNCGSSSIKYQLFEMPRSTGAGRKGLVERIGEAGSSLEPHVATVTPSVNRPRSPRTKRAWG